MAGKNGKGKLTEEQRLAVLNWIAEGLTTREINNLAVSFNPPFKISPQLNYSYRKDYDIDIQQMRNDKDNIAINTGLAVRANRIQSLIDLALMLEEDLKQKKLVWTKDVKSIPVGSGNMTVHKEIEFEEFNEAEIRQLRGIYDDLAKETGGRITRTDITSANKQIKGYVLINPDDWPDKPGDNK
jgi:hypothetical protein